MIFPNSPSIGQEITINGRSWQYDGKGWRFLSIVTGLMSAEDRLRLGASVIKAADSNLGIFSSKVHAHGMIAGKTLQVWTATSNFQSGNLASGTVVIEAPGAAINATYFLRVWYTAGTLTATGFTKVEGQLAAGQNFLFITCSDGVCLLNIVNMA